jgi:uncharacterized C2H2 Zn-finger protein
VFLSQSLLKKHDKKYHVESPVIEIDDQTAPHEEAIVVKQIYCALEETPDCPFQCNTKEELRQHIEIEHQSKKPLQCTVCNLYFKNLDDLARHMGVAHNNEELVVTCKLCGMRLPNKNEFIKHLTTTHKSYKPCVKFATNSCDKDECRFHHIRLQPI